MITSRHKLEWKHSDDGLEVVLSVITSRPFQKSYALRACLEVVLSVITSRLHLISLLVQLSLEVVLSVITSRHASRIF